MIPQQKRFFSLHLFSTLRHKLGKLHWQFDIWPGSCCARERSLGIEGMNWTCNFNLSHFRPGGKKPYKAGKQLKLVDFLASLLLIWSMTVGLEGHLLLAGCHSRSSKPAACCHGVCSPNIPIGPLRSTNAGDPGLKGLEKLQLQLSVLIDTNWRKSLQHPPKNKQNHTKPTMHCSCKERLLSNYRNPLQSSGGQRLSNPWLTNRPTAWILLWYPTDPVNRPLVSETARST